MYPYDYQQSHRAAAIFHARTSETQGFLLRGIDFTAVFTARGGHPYTREADFRYLGSWSPWSVGIGAIADPRFIEPLEAHNLSTTPFTLNLDFRFSKTFDFDVASVTMFLDVLNVLNTRNVLSVYPRTGTANDDGWLGSAFSEYYKEQTNYEAFYKDINLNNRWAYMGATEYDLYSPPRRIQFGMNITLGGSQ